MQKNVGGLDRNARLIVGPVLLVVGLTALVQLLPLGTLGAVAALVVGAVLTVTGVTQRCPLNALLGVDTCPVDTL